MKIGDRIKKVRQANNLTQQNFADRIGSKRNTVATYEMGRTEPSAAIISLICREFHINESWLRTGEGDMFAETSREDEITALVNQLMSGENAEFKRRFVRALASLTEKQWGFIAQKAQEIVGDRAAKSPVPDYEAEARAEAEEYYHQILSEKKAAAGLSALSPPKDA